MNECAVCRHPDRRKIEELMSRDASLGDIAQRFGLDYGAVVDHYFDCWSGPVPAELPERAILLNDRYY